MNRNTIQEMLNLTIPRPKAEYHEDMGSVLWWKFPVTEPPYVGSPNNLGITVEAHVRLISQMDQDHKPVVVRRSLGGWPGYHTHFTPIPIPMQTFIKPAEITNADPLITIEEVLEILPIKRSSWFEGINEGRYPKPIKFGRTARWRKSAILKLLDTGAPLAGGKS